MGVGLAFFGVFGFFRVFGCRVCLDVVPPAGGDVERLARLQRHVAEARRVRLQEVHLPASGAMGERRNCEEL